MTSEHQLLWLLNTTKGYMVLQRLMQHAKASVGLVSSYSDPNVSEDSETPIRTHCHDHGISYLPWAELKPRLTDEIQRHGITGIVAIGWQYLIPRDVWSALPDRLVVFHDSLLPKYRGFAPVASGMINGEHEFGVSVLYAGEGIDDGDLIHQARIHLGDEIYIGEAIERVGELYCDAALQFINDLVSGTIDAQPQLASEATYSIWRNADDGRIDWGRPAREIYNLIRAMSYPYPGAHSYVGERRVSIWRSAIEAEDVTFEIRDCGKIWKLDDGYPIVVCGSGMLRLTEISDENGESMLPITRLRQRFA